ncbi:MAG: RnfABCDGE type electron transport complex subunit B, partial [Pseudomonadota bacterium]|nr:RnfABCDGE type electron transport complex subunit B [Pseudomonadota bacterium]
MISFSALTPAVLIIALLTFALAVAQLRKRLPQDDTSLPTEIDSLLPQTQCAQCGYPGCLPYAEAVAEGAAIDLCPPGGQELVVHLRDLMGADAPLSQSATPVPTATVAVIDESACIGCTLCLPPCPVDAIVGAQGFMHTVVATECTGCELCIPACPVDCISLLTLPEAPPPVPAKLAPHSRGCINCGQCIEVCPRDLLPDQLFKLAQGHSWEAAADLGLQA